MGDPVGMGEAYLPSRDSKEAYAAACEEEITNSAARYAIELRTVEERRNFIATWPKSRRDELKAKITSLWKDGVR